MEPHIEELIRTVLAKTPWSDTLHVGAERQTCRLFISSRPPRHWIVNIPTSLGTWGAPNMSYRLLTCLAWSMLSLPTSHSTINYFLRNKLLHMEINRTPPITTKLLLFYIFTDHAVSCPPNSNRKLVIPSKTAHFLSGEVCYPDKTELRTCSFAYGVAVNYLGVLSLPVAFRWLVHCYVNELEFGIGKMNVLMHLAIWNSVSIIKRQSLTVLQALNWHSTSWIGSVWAKSKLSVQTLVTELTSVLFWTWPRSWTETSLIRVQWTANLRANHNEYSSSGTFSLSKSKAMTTSYRHFTVKKRTAQRNRVISLPARKRSNVASHPAPACRRSPGYGRSWGGGMRFAWKSRRSCVLSPPLCTKRDSS